MSKCVHGAPSGLAVGSVSLNDSTPTLIVPARDNRKVLRLRGASGMFIGGSAVTASDGFPIDPNTLGAFGYFEVETADAVYGIMASGSNTVRYLETFE